MDETQAALYAAIIGFAAAIIGAAVGGWASWKAARHSADAAVRAAVEQVAGQAANEHTHWVRQERLRVYSAVFQQYRQIVSAAEELFRAASIGGQPAEWVERLHAECKALRLACMDITLLGPGEVMEATTPVVDLAGRVPLAAQTIGTSEGDPERDERAIENTVALLEDLNETARTLRKACTAALVGQNRQLH